MFLSKTDLKRVNKLIKNNGYCEVVCTKCPLNKFGDMNCKSNNDSWEKAKSLKDEHDAFINAIEKL